MNLKQIYKRMKQTDSLTYFEHYDFEKCSSLYNFTEPCKERIYFLDVQFFMNLAGEPVISKYKSIKWFCEQFEWHFCYHKEYDKLNIQSYGELHFEAKFNKDVPYFLTLCKMENFLINEYSKLGRHFYSF